MANYPEITYRYPTEANGVQSELRPTITIDWSADMEETQFSNASERAKNVVLLEDETSTIIDTEFVDYTASSRRLELQPGTDLGRGKKYRIIVKNRLLSTDGRRSSNEYNWVFYTASGSISEVSLYSPGDATVQPVFPTLIWNTISATGVINYTVQIDDRWDFGTLAYSTTTTASSVTPAGVFSDDTTYYWRVMATTSSATGAWSDVRSFYYGRTADQADPTSRQSFPDADVFGVSQIPVWHGKTHLKNHPSSLSITFTSTPASSFQDYLEVISKQVLPRNDDEDSHDETTVSGTWVLSGSTITFTPTGTIAENTRYEIRLKKEMVSDSGLELAENYTYYWVGRYTPYYVSARVIRARFLGSEQQIPDDLINFYIHMASLEANARYYSYLVNPLKDTLGDSLSEATVRDGPVLQSHGVLKWVEAVTAYNLLKGIWMRTINDIGRTERLGDSLISLSADFVKGIEGLLKRIEQEIDQWEDFLTPSDIPLSVPRGFDWDPRIFDADRGIGRDIGPRDNGFY